MKWALWRKTIQDSLILTAAAAALLLLFACLYVYMGGKFESQDLAAILHLVPAEFTKMIPIPLDKMSTPAGRIAALLIDPTLFLTCGLWAVARGSDAISGEINRGTMEMLLAQPVPRYQIVLAQATVTMVCSALLAVVVIVGVVLGLMWVQYDEPIPLAKFSRGVFNLFALNVCLAGITTLLSSVDRYRWRTLALGGGFMVTQLIIKVLSRLSDGFENLRFVTIYGAYEPWQLIDAADKDFWRLFLELNGTLLAIGVASYVLATIIFCRRDLPAPL